ncbi:DNA-binding response OmpR family regulator [Sphingobium fontiphilum]|uniref:DNA-binding response OmpR family regulator n=1 Tax=Sphingobium fontiphilum TaxID=944425 RepID=A0A7W6DDV3_9SPHN|nr:response regulator [Sphingobium fontiphilum]MBB3980769.1 DNA-binding response OmpR family regulator [Sphingobium fontiphilum]
MFFGKGRWRIETAARKGAIRSILIVEDEPLVAFDHEHHLAQAGYRVAGTVDSRDGAIAVLNGGGVDLIIADVGLQGARGGIEVARVASDLGVPVLFATAACPLDARQWAVGCLAKPFSQRDLIAAIETVEALLANGAPAAIPPGMQIFPTSG